MVHSVRDPEARETVTTLKPEGQPCFQLFQDDSGRWFWQYRDEFDHLVYVSSSGYSRKAKCLEVVEAFKRSSGRAEILYGRGDRGFWL